MKKFTIVVADSNALLLQECSVFFKNDKEIEVIGIAENAYDCYNLLSDHEADAVIIELPLIKSAKMNFVFEISMLPSKPYLLPTASILDDGAADYCAENGLGFMTKPFSFNELKARLVRTLGSAQYAVKANKTIDERLSNIFIRAGIPPHIKGYQFLREAVKISVSTPDMINNVTKRLYPAVAEHFETSSSKVERAIRHAIEVAWSRGKIENINAIFGIKIYNKGEKPTNGELIALLADKLLIEGV